MYGILFYYIRIIPLSLYLIECFSSDEKKSFTVFADINRSIFLYTYAIIRYPCDKSQG